MLSSLAEEDQLHRQNIGFQPDLEDDARYAPFYAAVLLLPAHTAVSLA